jgi:hypothetical protein
LAENQNKVGLGKICEIFSVRELKSLFKRKDGYRIKHTDFKCYNWGFGVDIRVFKGCKCLFDIEVKNWRILDIKYSVSVAREEVLTRFKNSGAKVKILFISHMEVFSKRALGLLSDNNIHVFEIGKLIGKKDLRSKLFYQVKLKLQHFLNAIKSSTNKPEPETEVLDNYLEEEIDNTIVNSPITTIKNNKNTHIENNYLVAWVFSLLRPKEPKNRHEKVAKMDMVNAFV